MPNQVSIQDVDYTVAIALCEALEATLAPGSFIKSISIQANAKVVIKLDAGYVEVKAL